MLGKRVQQELNAAEEVYSKKKCINAIDTAVTSKANTTNEEAPIEIVDQSNSDKNASGVLSAAQIEKLEAIYHSNLIRAARIGHSNKIKEILGDYPQLLDRTHIGYSALHYAVFYNQREAVEVLIEAGANVDIKEANGITPLAWAVDCGHCDLVGYLLECEADPAIANSEGIAPIHTAVRSKNYAMVETLLSINTETEQWTDVNAQTKLGYTPAYFAAFDGSLEILQLLYDYGAKFNISSKVNVSPLHRATNKGHVEVVKYLIECGADVNKCDDNQRTCLHIAAFAGHKDLIEIFIHAKTRVFLDVSGRAPIDLARIRKHTEVVDILLEYDSTFE